MYRSVEMLLIREFALDLITLAAALRPMRRLRPGRLMAAAAAGALFAGFLHPIELSAMLKGVFCLLWAPVMARLAAGAGHKGAGAAVLTLSALGYALSRPLQGNALLSTGAYCVSVLGGSMLLIRKRRWQADRRVELQLQWHGRSAGFPALIDTGNRLREPISSLPVIVVGQDRLRGLLPEDYDPLEPWRRPFPGLRAVAFGGVGGSGVMGCFCPEAVKLDGVTAEEAFWVAVYPGPLPGGAGALAPPECMEFFAGRSRKHRLKEECSCRAPDP